MLGDPDGGPPHLILVGEVRHIAGAVVAALGWQVSYRGADDTERWRAATPGDITILLPARTSLAELERALDARDIAYRAEAASLVYATREVRDLMATLRALADPTDQLVLVTALRGRACDNKPSIHHLRGLDQPTDPAPVRCPHIHTCPQPTTTTSRGL